MTGRSRILTLVLIAASVALLIPGVTMPFFTLSGELDKARVADTAVDIIVDAMVGKQSPPPTGEELAEARDTARATVSMLMTTMGINDLSGSIEAYRKTRSIVGAVRELWDSGHGLVSFLVILFSVIIPVAKMLLLLAAAFVLKPAASAATLRFIRAISKWSMADVFVVAIMVAYLAANASKDMDEIVALRAHFETGFYFFLAFCLFSVASSQILRLERD